jgi:hypothetical protein
VVDGTGDCWVVLRGHCCELCRMVCRSTQDRDAVNLSIDHAEVHRLSLADAGSLLFNAADSSKAILPLYNLLQVSQRKSLALGPVSFFHRKIKPVFAAVFVPRFLDPAYKQNPTRSLRFHAPTFSLLFSQSLSFQTPRCPTFTAPAPPLQSISQ